VLNSFALEAYAQEVIRSRHHEAAQYALAAQLPRAPLPRPDVAVRLRAAHALRALALRLDPSSAPNPVLATATSR